jgi:UDP-N-acetyl-D-glucosamine/UDP-N-acetyl-D-galactosamine dehydrogenase
MNKSDFKICVVGLGYVGLPVAIALAKHFPVVGFDVNEKRVKTLSKGIDYNNDVPAGDISRAKINYTANPSIIKKSNFIIVAVPTPINDAKKPDMKYLESASLLVGKNLKKGSVVVFESTVYPGATEEVCVPIIEKESGLKCGFHWAIGYSPERINPGDTVHTVETITKVVAGMDKRSVDKIDFVYSQITKTFKASSIKVAEAAKVIENTQRDLNIALVNELSLIFKKLGIDTLEVLEAAGTKWNFLNFKPGLVGGHCIGVDPYYLTYKAESIGYIPQVILAGRRVNDNMHLEVVRLISEGLNRYAKPLKGSKVLILGGTFKENVKDARNSRIGDIVVELQRMNAEVIINDPFFEGGTINFDHVSIKTTSLSQIKKVDAVIIAVAHDKYVQLSLDTIRSWMDKPVIVDVKGVFPKSKDIFRL